MRERHEKNPLHPSRRGPDSWVPGRLWKRRPRTVPGAGRHKPAPAGSGQADEPVTLKVAFYNYAAQPADLQKVQDALNETLKAKIGCAVELTPISAADYTSRINLMLQNGDELDLLLTGTGLNYYIQAAAGQLLPLNDLLAGGGEGVAQVLGTYLEATRLADGEVYAVPVYQSYSAVTSFVMRKDILDKYGLKAADIKTLDDLERVFAEVHENEPGLACVLPEDAGSGVFGLGCDVLYDPLGDSLGVLPAYGQGSTVTDIFETEEYASWVYRLRDWFTKGYILEDIATNKEATAALMHAGRGFGHFTGVSVAPDFVASSAYGMEMEAVTFGDSFVGSSNVATICWVVARQSKHPEQAMAFLNLLYTDPDVVNTLCYGIEGEHYVKLDDGLISYPEGLDVANHPYHFGLNYIWGNTFLEYLPAAYSPDYYEKAEWANQEAAVSNALGFAYDNSGVVNEIAAVYNVVAQYMTVLGTGAVDPEIYLPEFIRQLKEAGIDAIVAEKQAQLDSWLASK